MKLVWSRLAMNDLENIRYYIAKDNILAAKSTIHKIFKSAENLIDQPAMGRPGRIVGTRELIINQLPYILPYRVKENILQILRVLHTSMEWPEKL
ncbi:MAG: type II toxin-antitoxin system RelE/ParE family toxin [Gammaproteobacteria bacterium]|nr:type II toxin-antitoxin system RelE/ParE family toxin [Gammaproteobacteria bacterium]